MENINHPAHYGGEENTYEAIKVIEAWNLGFCLGNVVKYVSRAGKKNDRLEDLKKALWYLDREIKLLKKNQIIAEYNELTGLKIDFIKSKFCNLNDSKLLAACVDSFFNTLLKKLNEDEKDKIYKKMDILIKKALDAL